MFSNMIESLMGGAEGGKEWQWLEATAALLILAWLLFVSTMVGILLKFVFSFLFMHFIGLTILPAACHYQL